jgi:hypothetical protein
MESPSTQSPKLRSFSVISEVMNAKKFIIKLESLTKKKEKKITDLNEMTESVQKNTFLLKISYSNSFLYF